MFKVFSFGLLKLNQKNFFKASFLTGRLLLEIMIYLAIKKNLLNLAAIMEFMKISPVLFLDCRDNISECSEVLKENILQQGQLPSILVL